MVNDSRRSALIALAAAMIMSAASGETTRIKLAELDLTTMESGWKPARVNQSVGERPLTVAGKVYPEGVGLMGPSNYELEVTRGEALEFHALVGADTSFPEAKLTSVRFHVYADGREVAVSPVLRAGQPPFELKADLRGAKSIVLSVDDGDDDSQDDLADYLAAEFVVRPGTELRPIEPEDASRCQFGILTPPPSPAPDINPPYVLGARPGRPILFRLPVSGERPLELSAVNLPEGLVFDARRGVLSGAVAERGEYRLVFGATNAHGGAEHEMLLKIGDVIALTPPMGWSSWNVFGPELSASNAMSIAKVLSSSPLADYGWAYLNLDDCWANYQGADTNRLQDIVAPARDANGCILPNRRFPDLKGMVDELHGMGLKVGIYSSPGPRTCCQCTGSFGYEALDAATFAEWGFDYLKYDWCSYGEVAVGTGRDRFAAPYRRMGRELRRQRRDIVYNFCQYGQDNVAAWAARDGGNSWRVSCDIVDTWKSVREMVRATDGLWRFAGPGGWNDPDMLVVGRVGWGKTPHPSRLTPNEQYSHFSWWTLLSAPLILGADLTRLDEFTLRLVTNPEVIAIDQDPLGAAAACVAADAMRMHEEVWVRPLADGSLAMGLFNLSLRTRTVTADLARLGLRGEWRVRDLWRRRDEGTVRETLVAELPVHAPKLVRLVPLAGAGFAPGVTDVRERSMDRLFDAPERDGADGCPTCPRRR